ncbi:MAG TPA: TIGR02147 family protein [Chitinispirillaceae bacterium]|nr:TIGR02147 family protein [Chitinispirillaceae bacterium]
MKSIFEYMDYREFLLHTFEEKKSKHDFYSYRLFSQKAGFKSPNFLKLVIDGDRNLTKESVFKVAKAFSLTKKESDYFENLVFLNQSKTLEEKNRYLTKLIKHREKNNPRTLEKSQYSYYSNWYNPIIHELITSKDFSDDFKKLGSMVIPPISASEAEKSADLLKELNLIKKNCNGVYVKTSATLTTGPQVRSVAVANYHKAMIQLASESVERFSSEKRDITSVTLSVSEQTCRILIEKVRTFRQELLELAETEKSPEKIVQINFQLFPLSENFGTTEDGTC